MRWLDGVLIAFGVFNIFAGLKAYFAPNPSLISLIAAGVSGLLIIVAAALAKSHPKVGYALATLITLLVGGRMLGAYMKSQAIWPALVFTILSGLVLACLVVGHFLAKKPA